MLGMPLHSAHGRTARISARRSELLDGLIELFLAEGFLGFSIDDLAARLQCSKSTLYTVAASKEQLFTAVVRAFFRRATERVEAPAAAEPNPALRIGAYLEAISVELAPASAQFFADIDVFAPAREIYMQNTAIATKRVRELVQATEPSKKGIDASFVGAVAGTVMESIQRGEMGSMTSLSDAEAYRQLADLIVAAVTGHRS